VLDRKTECCSRTMCGTCLYQNPRFQTYCPFCQISSAPTALPATGLRLPPTYTPASQGAGFRSWLDEAPPPYYDSDSDWMSGSRRLIISTATTSGSPPSDTEDAVHFVGAHDTLQSLSLAYKVPLSVLRQHNNLYSDPLLAARKWILIPKSHYSGPALSMPPDPEEEERKTKVRRWMVATKCADYSVATLYLKGSDYDLDVAVEAYRADEQWEKENPIKGKGKVQDRERRRARPAQSGSFTGQLL